MPSSRRSFITTAGCTLFLPALESFGQLAEDAGTRSAKRLLCLSVGNGICTDLLPKKVGEEYEVTSTTRPIEPYRKHFTIYSNFKGAGHHPSQMLAFTDESAQSTDKIKDSLDQVAASHIGHHTRVRNVVVQHDTATASWKNGLPVSPTTDPQSLFKILFGKIDKQKERELIELNRSVLDASRERARELKRQVSNSDQQKLEEYFAAIRESEKTIQKNMKWLESPRLEVPFPELRIYKTNETTKTQNNIFRDKHFVQRDIIFDLIHLAFKFDITRVFHFYVGSYSQGHHGISHRIGHSDGMQLHVDADETFTMQLAHYFENLTRTKTPSDASLMDETISLITSGNSICEEYGPHNGERLPVIVAGGGFKHGRHLACTKRVRRGNLYLTAMQKLGVPMDKFAQSTGTVEL